MKVDATLIEDLWIALNNDDPSVVEDGSTAALVSWLRREALRAGNTSTLTESNRILAVADSLERGE